jgi:4-hydroxybenzoate polyprenyltransferase
MGAFRNIFRLTRPLNLLIVLITLLITRFSVMHHLMDETNIGMKFRLSNFQFLLVILVALAATAAGNIINDYFDQKVDRINKPDEVIVGKTVKRRIAIILHQVLNIFAILCTVWLSWRTEFWWPILMTAGIITSLWWYSPIFKKQALTGNLIIALCTASVPIWSAWYEAHELAGYYNDMMIEPSVFVNHLWKHLFIISGFAFILTLIREAVKDMEDLPGDMEGEYHTLPIEYGIEKTKTYLYILLTIFMMAVVITSYLMNSMLESLVVSGILIIPAVTVMFKLHQAHVAAEFKSCSRWLKAIILIGLALLVWIYR